MQSNLDKKTTVEDCIKLSTFILNNRGAFKRSLSGTMSWLDYWSNKISVAYTINVDRFDYWLNELTPYLQLSYTTTGSQNQKQDINQKFCFSTTHCNFGGIRYWFVCPCGKRVANLYRPYSENEFRCRSCYDLSYESRNLSGELKEIGRSLSKPEILALEKGAKRLFYKGNLTKKYLKFEKEFNRFCSYHSAWYDNFMKKYKKRQK